MSRNHHARIGRRTMLRGVGGVAIALPFLDAMRGTAHAEGFEVPRRFVVWFTPNGHHAGRYPTSLDFAGTSFAPLAPHTDDLIVTRGLSIVSAVHQLGDAPHPTGFAHLLTGHHATLSGDDVLGSDGRSVDQVIADRVGTTPFRSSLHGIRSARPLSWSASGGVLPDNDPRDVFARLFSDLSLDPMEQEAIKQRKMDIVSTVRDAYADLRCRLGGEDRHRIEDHLESIYEIEARLSLEGVGCTELPPTPPDIGPTDPVASQNIARTHMQLLVKALECDLTRVGGIQWYAHTGLYGESNGWGGLGSHHDASHADGHNVYDEAYAHELAYFLDLLAQTPAEDGSRLLDHTVVLCVSELGLNTTHHHLADIGVTIAGSGGGALETGQYIDFLAEHRGTFQREPDWKLSSGQQYFLPFDVPHNRLLVELVNVVSSPEHEPIASFGHPEIEAGGLPAIRK